jgi:hypothetical protein
VDPAGDAGRFILYVEGARDREILGCWARRVDAGLARCVEKNTVILGGRRPARAVSDFLKRGGLAAGYRGLIVLDRDDHPHASPSQGDASGRVDDSPLGELIPDARGAMPEAGLELFVWSLRHIESYLLVPGAIRRMLGLDDKDRRVERSIDESLIASDESATGSRHSALHAKRFLGAGGSLSEALGTELRAGEIARAMRLDELHADVRLLFERIGTLSGLAVKTPEVVIRTSRRP